VLDVEGSESPVRGVRGVLARWQDQALLHRTNDLDLDALITNVSNLLSETSGSYLLDKRVQSAKTPLTALSFGRVARCSEVCILVEQVGMQGGRALLTRLLKGERFSIESPNAPPAYLHAARGELHVLTRPDFQAD
jgi:hypothetical protein